MPNPSVAELVGLITTAPPRCGDTRLVLVDGPAGSGKTTLANRLAVALGGTASGGSGTYRPDAPLADSAPVQIIHGDDMYEGWGGLATLEAMLLGDVLEPLAAGGDGAFRMWDWVEGRRSHTIRVPQRPFLLIEGVGSAPPRARELAVITLFVTAPWEVRLRRGLERDGEDLLPEWERWQVAEDEHLAASGLPGAADLVIDGNAAVPD